MKKDRNAFFEQSAYNKAFYPTPNMMNPTPSIASTSSQSFYEGPYVNNGYNEYNDLETRLAKIERQINRLDARISKIENANSFTKTDNINNNTDMYMV